MSAVKTFAPLAFVLTAACAPLELQSRDYDRLGERERSVPFAIALPDACDVAHCANCIVRNPDGTVTLAAVCYAPAPQAR